MRKHYLQLTTSQFAKLHDINKRTLHYYDSIGLFSPNNKGDNGYRYYDLSQSLDFEYVLMLKELNMSIDEIQNYTKQPTPNKFVNIINTKEQEIDQQINKLMFIKKIIQQKREHITLSQQFADTEPQVVTLTSEDILYLPYKSTNEDMSEIYLKIKDNWGSEQIRVGVGSMISTRKILNNNFVDYDGVYTPLLESTKDKKSIIKPKGDYICYYHKGKWESIPIAYQKIIAFAKKHSLQLVGYAYEIGMNEFVISKEEDYVTKIMIKVKCK